MNLDVEKQGLGRSDGGDAALPLRLSVNNPPEHVARNQANSSRYGASESASYPLRLCMFIARSTPCSVRAERNLMAALTRLDPTEWAFELEVIDVFADPRRALSEGIIVTPTLVAEGVAGPVSLAGDLADDGLLTEFLRGLRAPRRH